MNVNTSTSGRTPQPDITMPRPIEIAQYVATLSQTGTNDPIPTVLHNTLGNITWTRESQGLYAGTLTNGFPEQRTTIPPFSGQGGVVNLNTWNATPNDYSYIAYRNDNNKIYITVIKNSDASFADISEAIGAPILITINVYQPNTTQAPTPPPIPQPYKVYTARITQTATDDPTTTILQNTIGTIVWTRNDVGEYIGTLTGAFPSDKTIIPPFSGIDTTVMFINKVTPGDNCYAIYNGGDNNTVWLITTNAAGTTVELSSLGGIEILIEIRVYN